MRHDHNTYELKFGDATVTVRRRGSSHIVCGTILGQEKVPGTDMVKVWMDRMMFDQPLIEQESWRASGAISTIFEVESRLLATSRE